MDFLKLVKPLMDLQKIAPNMSWHVAGDEGSRSIEVRIPVPENIAEMLHQGRKMFAPR